MRGRLGVHLIACNEEANLPRCLDSIRGIADEIVVVDTGSTDRTAEIARSFGATVLSVPWTDSFAEARNAGLARAATDWVLVLDADEAVEQGTAGELAALLEKAEAEAYRVKLLHQVGDRPENAVVSEAVRLFRADGSFRYEGRIHEQLLVLKEDGGSRSPVGADSPLRLRHTGYLPGELARKGTALRNRRLLLMEKAERADDPFVRYNLGVSFCQTGEWREAETAFAEALKSAPFGAPYRATLVRDAAKLKMGAGGREEAMELLLSELSRYSDYADLHRLLGECYEAEGLLGEALDSFGKACSCGQGTTGSYVSELGSGSFVSRSAQARIALRIGQPQAAEELYRIALADCPFYLPALKGWTEALRGIGAQDRDIRELLLARIGLEHPSAKPLAAEALVHCGADEEAIDLLRECASEELIPCLVRTGRYREASELSVERARSREGVRTELLVDGAIAHWAEGAEPPEELLSSLPEEMRGDMEALTRVLAVGTESAESPALLRDSPSAERLVERLLELRLPELAESLAARTMNGRANANGGTDEGAAGGAPLAVALYRHGYLLRAADRFIRLMSGGELNAAGRFYLAEILCDRGHYASAAALFEQAAEEEKAWRDGRWGAAYCYLQLAKQTALEGAERLPEAAVLRADLLKIEQALAELERIGWRTVRTAASRRNSHA